VPPARARGFAEVSTKGSHRKYRNAAGVTVIVPLGKNPPFRQRAMYQSPSGVTIAVSLTVRLMP
jgi:hypothetical protein